MIAPIIGWYVALIAAWLALALAHVIAMTIVGAVVAWDWLRNQIRPPGM